jgi:hypothetical protein
MTDYYLKTTDVETLWDILVGLDLVETYVDDNGHTRHQAKGIDLDIIGEIYRPTEVITTDSMGLQYPEYAPIEGFHANIRGELTEAQQAALPLIPAPKTPYRVWA